MNIEPLRSAEDADWMRLRQALWPDTDRAEHQREMAAFLGEPARFVQFIARSERGAVGFVEASLRTDYVPGTESSPVAFLEGLYVAPTGRRQGVARSLVQAVVQWAVSKGCSELASDTQLENLLSQTVHHKLGFEESERLVFFRRGLKPHDA